MDRGIHIRRHTCQVGWQLESSLNPWSNSVAHMLIYIYLIVSSFELTGAPMTN